jgi:hypothetical protein
MAMAEQQPMYRAYTVLEREGGAPFWLNIGVAFVHKDSKGVNVILQALPLDGKLVLRIYEDDPENSKTERSSKDRRNLPEALE